MTAVAGMTEDDDIVGALFAEAVVGPVVDLKPIGVVRVQRTRMPEADEGGSARRAPLGREEVLPIGHRAKLVDPT